MLRLAGLKNVWGSFDGSKLKAGKASLTSDAFHLEAR